MMSFGVRSANTPPVPPPPPCSKSEQNFSIHFDVRLTSSSNKESFSILGEWIKCFKEMKNNNPNINLSVNIDFTQRE